MITAKQTAKMIERITLSDWSEFQLEHVTQLIKSYGKNNNRM